MLSAISAPPACDTRFTAASIRPAGVSIGRSRRLRAGTGSLTPRFQRRSLRAAGREGWMTIDTAKPFQAPTVDRLSVRLVVDSYHDIFMPKAEHPHVKIEHVARMPGRPRETFACEWGLSLHLESEAAGRRSQYLLDFGFTPEVLNRNFDLLGIAPAQLDGLILSHSHRDHYGGLAGFVGRHRGRMRDDLALYTGAGNLTYREKWTGGRDGGAPLTMGALDRVAVA